MEERDWQIIKALYQKKSINKAGESLYIAQPTLTKRLKQMEAELQVRIVNRGIKGVQFTPEGEYLAKRADEILLTYQSIREDVLNIGNYASGTLRIAISNFISKYRLPTILKEFKELYPDVDYQIETGYSRDIFRSTYNRSAHVGLIRGEYNWPDEKQLLFVEDLCIASLEEVDLTQLPSLPRIDYRTDQLYKQQVDNWWSENYASNPYIYMSVDQGDTCKEMVLKGLGYAIMPSLFFEGSPHIHKHYLLNKDGSRLKQKTWLLYYQDTLDLNIVRLFVQFIKERHSDH